VKATYLDSSAFVRTIVDEPESRALRRFLEASPLPRVSSALLRTEAVRAARRHGQAALTATRDGLRRVVLIEIDDLMLDAAAGLEPMHLPTLDAIHLAAAAALGNDLEVLVTYDERMAEGAAILGLPVSAPR
jgi:uncharacterized protein